MFELLTSIHICSQRKGEKGPHGGIVRAAGGRARGGGGVETEEVEPWRENGETWRRLKVTLPPNIASHSTVQIFYFDTEGLLKRHDYDVEVSGGTLAAHYVYQHEAFSGILVPTKRRVLRRKEDGTSIPEPLIVSIDLSEVEFS